MFVKTHSGNKTTPIVLLFVLATVILLASTARADALSFQSYTQRDGLADDYITQHRVRAGRRCMDRHGPRRDACAGQVLDHLHLGERTGQFLGQRHRRGQRRQGLFCDKRGRTLDLRRRDPQDTEYLQLGHPQQLPHQRRDRQAKPRVGRHVRRGRRAARRGQVDEIHAPEQLCQRTRTRLQRQSLGRDERRRIFLGHLKARSERTQCLDTVYAIKGTCQQPSQRTRGRARWQDLVCHRQWLDCLRWGDLSLVQSG